MYKIKEFSDDYTDYLHKYNKSSLREITYEEIKEYYEEIKKKFDDYKTINNM